jgi:uncharacterized cupin superfamily protein
MQHVHLDGVPWMEWSSTTGKFHGAGKQVSEALGAKLNANLAAGGHPFDLEYGKLQPGKAGCPYHSHSAQWECYYIVSGTGTMRHGDQRREVGAGDVALHPPGSAHQLINTGDTDLIYYLVADNPLTEFWHYPDSDKYGFKPGGAIFRKTDAHYDLGEDDPPDKPLLTEPRPALPDVPAQFIHINDIKAEHRYSPKGKFSSHCRDISLALGGKRNADVAHGGHPFDLQIRRIDPGAAICPYHSHSAQWELLIFLKGHGRVRTADGTKEVGPGDIVLHPPGTPHQTRAAPDSTLECLIITDNPKEDVCYYPDSDKWGILSARKYFRITALDYFDGEE